MFGDPSGLKSRPLTLQEWQSLQALFPGSQLVTDPDGNIILLNIPNYTFEQVAETLRANGFPYQSQNPFTDYTWNPIDHPGEYECRARNSGMHLTLPYPTDWCDDITGYCHSNWSQLGTNINSDSHVDGSNPNQDLWGHFIETVSHWLGH
jgi:hypothetical protein